MRPHHYRARVGGLWDEVGALQLAFLQSVGMKPEHKLLDVGCGCFRGGVRFLKYVGNENYVGLDKDQSLVLAGFKNELPQAGIDGKTVTTVINEDFDLSGYDAAFDYAIAQSVFPHITRDEIKKCVRSVCKSLKPGGCFYATYFPPLASRPSCRPVTHESVNPFHQNVEFYEDLAADLNVDFGVIGDWGHPRSQQMLGFAKQNGGQCE